jgi:hypothetical protein
MGLPQLKMSPSAAGRAAKRPFTVCVCAVVPVVAAAAAEPEATAADITTEQWSVNKRIDAHIKFSTLNNYKNLRYKGFAIKKKFINVHTHTTFSKISSAKAYRFRFQRVGGGASCCLDSTHSRDSARVHRQHLSSLDCVLCVCCVDCVSVS